MKALSRARHLTLTSRSSIVSSLLWTIAPDTGIALRYAHIRAETRSRGALIPDNDIWLAATALEYGLSMLRGTDTSCVSRGLSVYEVNALSS
jgi:predicted nucleic acid-binding protein